AKLRIGGRERNRRGRSRRDERHAKGRTSVPRMAQRHLDLSSTAAGLAVDDADAVRAVLGQPVFRVAHEQQLGKDQQTDRSKVAAVVIVLYGAIGIVEFRSEHLLYVHDRDAAAPAVLQELGVVHGAVMVDHVGRPTILAEHDVRRILDGTLVGDPANIVLSEDRRTAYVINHHGPVNNAEFLQHGGRGSVSVMDVKKMLRPEFDDTDRAVEQNYDSGYFGAVGLLVLPELLLVSHSENWLTEDGSNRISIIDRKTGGRRGQIEMALGHPGHACPAFPVPFVSPTPPPAVPFAAPDPQFGCWP